MKQTGIQDRSTEPRDRPAIDAHDARGGEIILRSRRQRTIFIAGMVGFVVLAIVLALAALI